MKHVFQTTVVGVNQEFKHLNYRKTPEPSNVILYDSVDLGWFVTFEGSHEKVFFGMERPDVQIGDKFQITMEKTND